jgi:multicomponent Na+:H+ antiporter subunit D
VTFVDHLPVLVVVVPLMAAPLCVLLDRPLGAWLVSLFATWFSFGAAVQLLIRVSAHGAISYPLGGWAAPWGIEYRIDLLGAYVLLIVTAIAALVMVYAQRSVESEIPRERIARFYAAVLLAFAGLTGITVTGDAFNVFVFLEISSLASYAIISMGRDRRALSAAFQYLVMGTLGATFILIGIGFLYMMTGTLNMQDLGARLPEVADTRTVRAGFAFLTIGLGLKLALFPLHQWLPNAYTYAPSMVTAFLAATATKVAVYALLRFLLGVFDIGFSLDAMPLDLILMVLGIAAILSASLVAVFQEDVKRMLAYSSIAQIGYMVLGIGLATSTGISAAVLHLFNHALMKGALFLALGAVVYRLGSVTVHDLAGLGRRMPWTMAAVVLGGLSLIGVPPTAGFISKWYLVLGVLERDLWPIAVVVLVGSLLALVYVWRLVEAAYFGRAAAGATQVREAPLSMLAPIWLLIGANLYFGVQTDLSVGIAQQATGLLIGSGR